MDNLLLFSGSSNLDLSEKVAKHLGVELSPIMLDVFSDMEKRVRIKRSVRGKDLFIIQSTSTPGADNLMELLMIVDAARRASVKSITVVTPYFGFSRQDRKTESRTPITSKLVANLLVTAGIDRLITMDLHSGQIQGFFDIPVDNLYASPVLVDNLIEEGYKDDGCVIVSPDAGGVQRARAYGKLLNCSIAMVDKRRPEANIAKVMNVIGDVKGKKAVIVDDMIDTAGTLTIAAEAILDMGAVEVISVATHGILSGSALDSIEKSQLSKIFITDTIDVRDKVKKCSKLSLLSVSRIIANSISRVYENASLAEMFGGKYQ